MEIRIGMPQMAVRGLSENWLFKFCGDRHWNEIARRYGVDPNDFRTPEGERIYPSFVAIRARYATPLTLIEESQTIAFDIELDRFGSSIIRSRQKGCIAGAPVIALEMITKFVSRVRNNLNDLRTAPFELKLAHSIPDLDQPPQLVRDFQKVRDGTRTDKPREGGRELAAHGKYRYEPNPYVDYNGAGLLYFASYPAIADHIERLLIARNSERSGDADWALRSGTSARDVFYFGNLDLGQSIEAELKSAVLAADESEAELHTVLSEASQGRRIAELFTSKKIL